MDDMTKEEVKYYLKQLSKEDQLGIILDIEQELSVEIANEVTETHKMFVLLFSMLMAVNRESAIKYWKNYWTEYGKPEYTHEAWISLLLIELKRRDELERELQDVLKRL
jgi:hypothetical protein